jgi:phosphatidylserine/phosphatidylglycerophosphate/cardiolipin synthase-like enzyme
VQLLRTYPHRVGGYPFAPGGERSIAHGYMKALGRARQLIYVEDQYLWSRDVAGLIADALRRSPDLHLIAVLPHFPDQDGRLSMPPNLVGRAAALEVLKAAAPDRVGVYGIENSAGTPIYVHAKVCVIDDVWATTGSDNFNRRSWTHDSELTAAVWDPTHAYARDLRIELAREHLGLPDRDGHELADPRGTFAAFAAGADALEAWHRDGQRGPRPPGRLRPLAPITLSWRTRAWATPLYRVVYDPDGRRARDRWRNRF